MGTFFFRRKNKMKAVFASALVAAATALPWEDSQLIWSEPSIDYGANGVSYDVNVGSSTDHQGNVQMPYSWGPWYRKTIKWRVCYDKNNNRLPWYKCPSKVARFQGPEKTGAPTTSDKNEFCSYFSVYRPRGEGSSAFERNMVSGGTGNLVTGPNVDQWDTSFPNDAVQSATKSTFCKACFGGDDAETTARFRKACFGGDVEVQTKFCKACFGGGDVETTARFCKSCFGGDDAEVKARFRKSCFGGDDAEVHSRFCKSCFGGDVEARVKCDCSNNANKNESHYGLSDFIWGKLKDMMSKSYSILAAAHELGVDPDACECALGTDSTTKHYLPGGGLAYDKLLASTHDQMIMSYAIPQYSFAQF